MNGESVYMADLSTNGTNWPNGSLIINCTPTMFDGSSKYPDCTTCTNKVGLLKPLRTSFEVRFYATCFLPSHNHHPCRLLDVFQPLFEVTKNPKAHPELYVFLQRVIGFDSVDDESKTERRFHKKFPFPRLWDTKESPPYSYWSVSVSTHIHTHPFISTLDLMELMSQAVLHLGQRCEFESLASRKGV